MKLLFFAGTLKGGGAERVLSVISSELAKRGHEITIALNKNECAYELDSRIKLIAAPYFAQKGKENVIQHFRRNLHNVKCFYSNTRNAIRLVQPDVIVTFLHCNMNAILLYHNTIPIVHSEHNAYDRNLGLIWKYNRFFLNRFFNKVFVLTPFDHGYAKARRLHNTEVMPNPNSFQSISVEEYLSSLPQRKNILACGRIKQWKIKGFDLAIEVFSKIAYMFPNVDLDIAGEGDDSSLIILEGKARELGIEERVHFLGKRNDIQGVMREHKLFILSSRTEGFPLVVTEAMTQGLPCVAFDRLASSIILDGIDGALVSNYSIDEMANVITRMLNDDQYLQSCGLEAIKNVSRFSVEKIADKWENTFSSLIEGC